MFRLGLIKKLNQHSALYEQASQIDWNRAEEQPYFGQEQRLTWIISPFF